MVEYIKIILSTEEDMGLLDQLKNSISQVTSKQEAPVVVPKSTPAPAPAKAVAETKPQVKDSFRVKFGDEMPYYDPEFGSVNIMFNGFAEVKSESWAKDPKGESFVKMIIDSSIKNSIMKLNEQKVSYNDLTKHGMDIRKNCEQALKDKNIEAKSVALNTINLTAESKERVDSIKKSST